MARYAVAGRRLGLAQGDPRYDGVEARLAAAPDIAGPTITLDGELEQGVKAVSRLSVVIADDHPVVRAGLRALMSREESFEIVAEGSTGPETVQAVASEQPSVLVLDLTMAGQSSRSPQAPGCRPCASEATC